jgi:hypothetical protein
MNNKLFELPIKDIISLPMIELINSQSKLNDNYLNNLNNYVNDNNELITVNINNNIIPLITLVNQNNLYITGLNTKFNININNNKSSNLTGFLSNNDLDKKCNINIDVVNTNSIGINKLIDILSKI